MSNNYVKNHRPKVRKPSYMQKTVPFRYCISKFHIPKNPNFHQKLYLEWFLKWN